MKRDRASCAEATLQATHWVCRIWNAKSGLRWSIKLLHSSCWNTGLCWEMEAGTDYLSAQFQCLLLDCVACRIQLWFLPWWSVFLLGIRRAWSALQGLAMVREWRRVQKNVEILCVAKALILSQDHSYTPYPFTLWHSSSLLFFFFFLNISPADNYFMALAVSWLFWKRQWCNWHRRFRNSAVFLHHLAWTLALQLAQTLTHSVIRHQGTSEEGFIPHCC